MGLLSAALPLAHGLVFALKATEVRTFQYLHVFTSFDFRGAAADSQSESRENLLSA